MTIFIYTEYSITEKRIACMLLIINVFRLKCFFFLIIIIKFISVIYSLSYGKKE